MIWVIQCAEYINKIYIIEYLSGNTKQKKNKIVWYFKKLNIIYLKSITVCRYDKVIYI